jgi:hypothetical protein
MYELRKAGKRGKLPSTPPAWTINDFLVAPIPPAIIPFDWATKVTGGFPMALNDQWGDCTIAGVVHLLQLIYAVVGQTFVYPGDTAVLDTYCQLLGIQPSQLNANTDTGLVETDVLNAWMTGDGLFGTKIVGWAPIKVNDWPTMESACYSFGGLYLGGDIPQISETQFEEHKWWTTVPGNNPPIGGHCFTGSGAVAPSPMYVSGGIKTETWGAETGFTRKWWAAYGTNCYVVLPQLFQQVGHGALASVDTAKLQTAIADWNQQQGKKS